MRPDRTANPFDWRDRRFTGHAGSIASGAMQINQRSVKALGPRGSQTLEGISRSFQR
jgi:hypothetical protein